MTYDVTDAKSFENVKHWLQEIDRYSIKAVDTLLVGNKSDFKVCRQISTEQGQELADSFGIEFLETSAKTGYNVEQAFIKMAMKIRERLRRDHNVKATPKSTTRLGDGEEIDLACERRRNCC